MADLHSSKGGWLVLLRPGACTPTCPDFSQAPQRLQKVSTTLLLLVVTYCPLPAQAFLSSLCLLLA